VAGAAAFGTVALSTTAWAQTIQHPAPILSSIFPAGAQQGQSVTVLLRGQGVRGGEHRVVIDGPPGISASDIAVGDHATLKATFRVAADAVPGARMVRVHHLDTGLTNFRYFHVGVLPEVAEKEPNDTAEAAQAVAFPKGASACVVNGCIQRTLDIDWYRFTAKAGQNVVAAVLAHGMDVRIGETQGFLDTSLELRDAAGKVLAASEDALGLDPLIELKVPRDGDYLLAVRSLAYEGSAHAVYRLMLGEAPYPTVVFPPGGQRGQEMIVDVSGPNVAAGTRQAITVPTEGSHPLHSFSLPALNATRELTLLRGDFPEIVESESNDHREQAAALKLPTTVNGRFGQPGDEDWYRLRLEAGKGVLLQTIAQRELRSPVDTHLQVCDAAGKPLAENDDGSAFAGNIQCAHDFVSSDSFLMFTPPAAGDYLVRVRNRSEAAGPRAIYRLHAEPLRPDFTLYQWPDAVPVWGAGTSAAFVVEVLKWGPLDADIDVAVEGLPSGWQGSVARWPRAWYSYVNGSMANKLLVTITAPADAALGTLAPLRVVGRAKVGDRSIEHEARYMTLYGSSHNDRMHVRGSPVARAVVCKALDSSVSTTVKELTVEAGQSAQLPVSVKRTGGNAPLGLVVNGPTPSAGCNWGPPLNLRPDQTEATLEIPTRELPPGTYAITAARSWASDLRAGRPGPCTPLVLLHIKAK
jgi:hypothetical protein